MSINTGKNQRGFTLAITLIIVGLLASVLTGVGYVKKGETIRNEASIAGWEGAKIARAARIHSRDEIIARPTLVTDLDPVGGTGPEEISLSVLINKSLLPQNFARRDAAGNYYNALGQRIRVFIANWPISGNPTLPTTVPTAYVIFEDNTKTTPDLMQDVVQSARAENVSVSAPIYNGATNITGLCNGGTDTIALWDSGCMGTSEYTTLTGSIFQPGSFVIPSWRSVSFDTRAVMRFPQPEQIGLQTMLTDLEMAEMNDCVADPTKFITIFDDNGVPVASDICSAISDDPTTMTDNRRSIIGVNNIDADALVANPQSGNDVSTDTMGITSTTADEVYAVNIAGTLQATGDAKIHNGTAIIANDLNVDRNISVSSDSSPIAASANIGTLNAGQGLSTNLNVSNTATVTANASASNDINSISNTTIANSVVSEQLVGTDAGTIRNINVSNTASVLGATTVNATNIAGAGQISGYSYVAGRLVSDPGINVIGNTAVAGTTAMAGNTILTNTIDVHNGSNSAICIGDCPLRTIDLQCQQLAALGIEPYATCMARHR